MQDENPPISNTIQRAIGFRLREERERLRLSQPAFGEAAGVKKGAQIKYEQGERLPDAWYMHLIASIGADVLYIITGVRSENTATSPIELSYLRLCRALPTNDARMAGNAALGGLLTAYSSQMNTNQAANEYGSVAAQNGVNYGKSNDK